MRPIDVVLIPAGDPPHRETPHASAQDRVAMLELAVREVPGLLVDTREIARGGKSYTVDTLGALRAEMPARPLALLVGADAFRGLPAWHRWKHLFDLAHVIVVPRPGTELAYLPDALASEWKARKIDDSALLRARTAGSIYVQPVTAQPISSTGIREALAGNNVKPVEIAGLLPASFLALIYTKRLYRHPPHAF